jgi:Ca2+:H+ antiporter
VSLEIAVVLFVSYLLMLLFSLKTHRHLYAVSGSHEENEAEADSPAVHHWSVGSSVAVLLLATVGVSVMSERLVGAIEATREQFGWTEVFVGVIVVAVVGNAAEHSTAILVAMKNQMELAFQIAVGSGLQIALFVAPVLVFLSMIPGFTPAGTEPLNLVFSMLEVVAVALSVLIVGLVAHDGESNWLGGLLLIAVYVILGIAFFHLPG